MAQHDRSLVEYAALHTAAGLVRLDDRTQIELTGDDRVTFLHNLCTNDIKKLAAGKGCEAFLCNAQGRTLAHVYVFCRADSLVLETVPGQGEFLLKHLDRYLIRERVELHDRTGQWAELLLAGPQAGLIVAQRFELPQLPPELLAHCQAPCAGGELSIRKVDWIGPQAWLLSLPRPLLADAASQLEQLGAMPCGPAAFEMARMEQGTPLYGVDITDKNLPQELARDQKAISFTKGCYLGQETIARIDALGHVNQTLCGVRWSGSAVPAAGTELSAGSKVVGHVTSAAFSPACHTALALAYVRRGFNEPGQVLQSDLGEAFVVRLPIEAAAQPAAAS
jgi:folate-binding protein YgfZ